METIIIHSGTAGRVSGIRTEESKMKKRIFAAALAVVLFGSVFVGCKSDKEKNPKNTNESGNPTTEASTEWSYDYGALNYGGKNIRFMTLDYLWDMYIYLDRDIDDTDRLDVAVYNRDRHIEEKYKCKIDVYEQQWNWSIPGYANEVYKVLASGDDMYDVIYVPINAQPSIITEGRLYNLENISSLQLNRDWWDNSINNGYRLADNLYFASGSLMLQSFDSAWAIFFNQKLIEENKLDNPYDIVDQDNWTLDTLMGICRSVANINSSSSFEWGKGDGDQLYGISTHPNLPDKLIYASGERYVKEDKEGNLYFAAAESERFVNVATKLMDFLSYEGNLRASSEELSQENAGYIYPFTTDRAVFLGAEIKTGRYLKQKGFETEYGIVPLPKYDENQTEYYTPIVENLLVFTIPTTCTNPEEIGTIVDAMTYLGYTDVLPEYYNQTLYRGLNNEEDGSMLDIISSSRGVDMAYFYGWNTDLAWKIGNSILSGQLDFSSSINAEKDSINQKITDWLTQLENINK